VSKLYKAFQFNRVAAVFSLFFRRHNSFAFSESGLDHADLSAAKGESRIPAPRPDVPVTGLRRQRRWVHAPEHVRNFHQVNLQ
jgi:hypothetical protein